MQSFDKYKETFYESLSYPVRKQVEESPLMKNLLDAIIFSGYKSMQQTIKTLEDIKFDLGYETKLKEEYETKS